MKRAEVLTPALLRDWPLPEIGGSKDDRGTVLVVGGARSTPGAAMLSGLAALRVGCGRLTFAVASSVATAVAVAVPEAGVVSVPETPEGHLDPAGAEALKDDLARATVVLVGPGLAGPDETTDLLRGLLARVPETCAVVLDAFALGVLRDLDRALLRDLTAGLVLTPNISEAARLLGRDASAAGTGPGPDDASEIAREYGAVVTLHGALADPTGRTWEASTGSTGLATSGSGDVLAGAVAGLLARGADPPQAACWGTHLHGASGDRLGARIAPAGYLARELLDELPLVLTELQT